MVDALLQLLAAFPVGLLAAALLLEGFLLSRQDRTLEPAVLWLLFWAVVMSAVVSLTFLALHLAGWSRHALAAVLLPGGVAAVGSLAWLLKRQARNRSFLLLREKFFDATDPKRPPQRKPWQAFLILGYRTALSTAAVAALMLPVLPALPAGGPSPASSPLLAAPPPASGPPEIAAALPEAPPSGESAAGELEPVTGFPKPIGIDPTRAEIPSGEASAMAALMTSSATIPPTAGNSTEAEQPSQRPPATDSPPDPVGVVRDSPARPVSKNSLYFSRIRPILSRHCVSCHGSQKQKGDLRLDSPDAIRAGINGKPVIIPGAPQKSRIYHVTGLPLDDTDRMPPKGNPLNQAERTLLFTWIRDGADLGDGVSLSAGTAVTFKVDDLAATLTAPDPVVLEALKKDHVIVRELSANGFVLEVDFSNSDRARSSLKLNELGPIALNIHTLDLGRTMVSDADLAFLAPMKHLSRLLLARTGIGDAGLAHLSGLGSLEHLNLYQTQVTDGGLASLESLKSLRKLYLWQSRATPQGAGNLQAALPALEISLGE